MSEPFADRRLQIRHHVNLPVVFDSGRGTTLDMSAAGIRFETNQAIPVGSEVSMAIKLARAPGGPVVLRCTGHILRVQNEQGRVALVAALDSVEIQPVNDLDSAFAEKERGHA